MTDVTIVVVPRERFSYTARSLESIYEHTDIPFSLVYVDGGSPARIKRYLAQQAQRKNFKLIRTERYLSPNQARNLGLKVVQNKYVVFVDNDVLVTPGWLKTLVDCAETTGAWVVSPLTLVGSIGTQTIHAGGGTLNIKEDQGRRVFDVSHGFAGKSVADVASDLRPQTTELAEFHCMLILTEACKRVGPFDEGLFSMHEHEDFCLAVRECGGSVYFEPRSVITYVAPPPFAWSDLPFFMLRWSEAWNFDSHQHFRSKWGLDQDDKNIVIARNFAREHRHLSLRLVRGVARRLSRVCRWQPDRMEQRCLFPAEARVNRYLVRLLS
ncbi:MAG: glycosyltransferase [Pyrinomonadaceae bacterium]|nr:glycosyltransferase [Pyrinomonadaceae bacterium]